MVYENQYLEMLHDIKLYKKQKNNKKRLEKLPFYVKLDNSYLRLDPTYDEYVCENGSWSVKYKISKGKVYSVSNMQWLNNIKLKKITFNTWYKKSCIEDEE
jgi:hypothetical protein